jgi:hypothetical protein
MADNKPTMYDLLIKSVIGKHFIDPEGRIFYVEDINLQRQTINPKYLDGKSSKLCNYWDFFGCEYVEPSELEQMAQPEGQSLSCSEVFDLEPDPLNGLI